MNKSEVEPRLAMPGTGVVITGGASGLGFASACAVAAVGRDVALWDLDQARAMEAADQLTKEFGVTEIGLRVDVRDLAAIRQGAATTLNSLKSVGGLVHCAGTVDTAGLDGMTEESWNDGIAVHLRALPFLVKAFLPAIKSQPGSAVVATSSINATLGNAINPIYSAGKGGILAVVRSLADRLAKDGIRINSVSPGQIMTPMMRPAVEACEPGFFEKRILLNRIGEPEELGRVVRFLLSEEASYITAAEIVVDGGNISSQRA